jgi:hypothetical protein
MLKILFFLIIQFSIPLAASAGAYVEPTEKDINLAIKTFKYKDQWINPLIVKEFLPWMSDHDLPLITSIDVGAATDTNRYFGAVKSANNNASAKTNDGSTITYEWMGQLKNGMHVLLINESGGGTMIATSLAIFKLHSGQAINQDEKKYHQLVLEIQRILTLGDRAQSIVSISGNNIDVDIKCNKTCESKHLKLTLSN